TLNAIVCLSLCHLLSACSEDPASAPLGGGGAGNETGGAGSGGDDAMGGAASGGAEAGGSAPVGSSVMVTVRDYEGEIVAGVDVIANDVDGALVDEAVTDGAGLAELSVPDGGSISVLHENDYGWSTPGALDRSVDTIVFADTPPEAVAINILVVTEPEPAEAPMILDIWYSQRAGATKYQMVTSCGSEETPALANGMTHWNCTDNDVFDAVLLARTATGAIVDYARLDDLPFAAGAYQSHLMTWTGGPISQIQFALSNIPEGGAVGATSTAREREPGGAAHITRSYGPEQASGAASFSLQHVAGYGTEHCQQAIVYLNPEQSSAKTYFGQRCSAAADLSTFTLNAARLTRFDPITQNTEPHTLRWEAGDEAALGDVLSGSQLWFRGEEVTGTWSVYLAPSVREVRFPELPEGLAEFAREGSDVLAHTIMVHKDFDELDSFDAAVTKGVPEVNEVSVESYSSTLGE
ncbi:MAG: hypothetical protein JNK04_16175, partial [Myxococcales bacterium]|nr:hypothetical protein [Myxococcales bacterium]